MESKSEQINQVQQTELQEILRDHMKTVTERDGNRVAVHWQLFTSWPHGNEAGELLMEAEIDNTLVEERGISGEWLEAVGLRMEETQWYIHKTREVVEHFIKPLTKTFACPLYYFIPKKFRNSLTSFISHSWDGNFSDVMIRDDKKNFYWLDIIAINQHNYGCEIGKIGDTVEACGETRLILPGSGDPRQALRPIYRSWCIFEIAHTKEENFHPTLRYCYTNYENHESFAKEIKDFSVKNAEALHSSDKETIDDLVLDKFGTYAKADKLVRERIQKAFYDTYTRHGVHKGGNNRWLKCAELYKV